MLITELKSKEEILSLAGEKAFIINCLGCKEIYFPEKEAKECRQAIAEKLGCFMGHYSGIADRDGTMYCTWKSRSIRRFSQDLLEERHPDLVSVIEDCYTERPTRFLRICNGVHEI